jgi:catechol 2,3-dioxygenase-like lactoylglutathione lyase family enzyme
VRGRKRGSAPYDRWSRQDWWGVVLDTPDPRALARFYSDLLGWPVWRPEEGDGNDATLDLEEGVGYISFQRNDFYVRPVWPVEAEKQQMMMHLDFEVSNLGEATANALDLGAELAAFQPQDDVRVLLDPDGHPFCLFETKSDQGGDP